MITSSVFTLFCIGLFLAFLLVIASLVFRVDEDPRVEELIEVLPGANCGGCGFAGCEAYAIAVLNSADVSASLCTVGGSSLSELVGKISGKRAELSEPMRAFRRCSRIAGEVSLRYDYVGPQMCSSAAQLEGGPFSCSSACLGLGDCQRACQFGAIEIIQGLAFIIEEKCVACSACVKSCPRNIIQMIPRRARVCVDCRTTGKMKAVSDVCGVGCIKCAKCVKACPAGAVRLENGQIEFDHAACLAYGSACEEACVGSCPRHILCPFPQEKDGEIVRGSSGESAAA